MFTLQSIIVLCGGEKNATGLLIKLQSRLLAAACDGNVVHITGALQDTAASNSTAVTVPKGPSRVLWERDSSSAHRKNTAPVGIWL